MEITINGKTQVMSIGGLLKGVTRRVFTHEVPEVNDEGKWVKVRKPRSMWKTYLAICFSFFMIEEGIQMVMFSTFPLQEIHDYARIEARADTMVKMSSIGKGLNYAIGWINPIMFLGYHLNYKASEMYADSLYVLCEVNGVVRPATDVVAAAASTTSSTVPLMNNTIRTTAGTVIPVDMTSLSTIKIGMPTWSDPPQPSGAIVIDEAQDLPEVLNLKGFSRTIVFPVTAIDPRASVINAKSPFLFALTAFPRNIICYELLKQVKDYWLVVNGEIGEFNGAPQIILNSPNQILAVQSMSPDGVLIPFDQFYAEITGAAQ